MANDLKTGLYVCPECEEVFALHDELPVCESCLSLLDRCGSEGSDPERLALAA
jgi:hypothetical protein